MPALVKSRLGSFSGTSGALGTTVWPRWRKKSRKPSRTWSPVTKMLLAAPSRSGNSRRAGPGHLCEGARSTSPSPSQRQPLPHGPDVRQPDSQPTPERGRRLPEGGGEHAAGREACHDPLVLGRALAELPGEDVVPDVEHGLRRQLEPPFGKPLAPVVVKEVVAGHGPDLAQAAEDFLQLCETL